jgi:hypothetical protein
LENAWIFDPASFDLAIDHSFALIGHLFFRLGERGRHSARAREEYERSGTHRS